ncbi:MAG: DUF3822 family protein [Tannerella sp.]|jgi:hypothetical protein|nr:DUF3822 family protein [Tannerella sp.]
MGHRVSNTLTPDNAGQYIVSIRLRPGGLSFAGIHPDEKKRFFCEDIILDRKKTYVQALKEAFFSHAFFSYSFKHVFVLCVNRRFTVVPANVFAEKQKEELMSFTFSTSGYRTLYEPADDLEAKVVFGVQSDVYEFCARSLLRPQYVHAATRLLTLWRKQSLTHLRRQLYVALHEGIMYAACFDKGVLCFVNSFNYEDTADILYYTLYIWKQLGMEQLHDVLHLAADTEMYEKLSAELKIYLSHIQAVAPPWPDMPAGVPPDVMALFACES